jgi:hypothetical protein
MGRYLTTAMANQNASKNYKGGNQRNIAARGIVNFSSERGDKT